MAGTGDRRTFRAWALGTLILVVACYWPVGQGGFVWDDDIYIHDNAWLWPGSDWLSTVFHGFPDWGQYFRPLGLLLIATEIRIFGIAAAPMHWVSLSLHLANTCLVGMLGRSLGSRLSGATDRGTKAAAVAMLVYGLHPALIEPIAWISSQFDLLLTFFMLSGLQLYMSERSIRFRAASVSVCFFLAACTKETAVVFPLLLAAIDAFMVRADRDGATRSRGMLGVVRQWPVYAAMFAAGIVYLLLRHAALMGKGISGEWEPFASWQRLHAACLSYLAYWRMLVWPFVGLSPAHVVDEARLAHADLQSGMVVAGAIAIGLSGVWLAWKGRVLGMLIVLVTLSLLPVLHLIPIAFDESLYHERYAILGVALACASLPAMCLERSRFALTGRVGARGGIVAAAAWVLLAAFTIRTTLPLWADDARLWRWTLSGNPESTVIQDHLLAILIERSDWSAAEPLARKMAPTAGSCASCMINIAIVETASGNLDFAARALARVNAILHRGSAAPSLVVGYEIVNGNLLWAQGDLAGAEQAYNNAIALDPRRPDGYKSLALLLLQQGRLPQARTMLDQAASRSAPDTARSMRAQFEAYLPHAKDAAGSRPADASTGRTEPAP
ncbi:MAG: tetratricopeptide repeat protein [Proteobacteria bacterium]|nr:tetratricopeptide repeat protein [Pseudomonadota bacterium]